MKHEIGKPVHEVCTSATNEIRSEYYLSGLKFAQNVLFWQWHRMVPMKIRQNC